MDWSRELKLEQTGKLSWGRPNFQSEESRACGTGTRARCPCPVGKVYLADGINIRSIRGNIDAGRLNGRKNAQEKRQG